MSQNKSEGLSLYESVCEAELDDSAGNSGGFSCVTCPVKECPTRGLAESQIVAVREAERGARLSPIQMIFWSATVFLFPLICAVIGICCWESISECVGIRWLPMEAGHVVGAFVGFVIGLATAWLGVRVARGGDDR